MQKRLTKPRLLALGAFLVRDELLYQLHGIHRKHRDGKNDQRWLSENVAASLDCYYCHCLVCVEPCYGEADAQPQESDHERNQYERPNIGTTFTFMFAALAVMKANSIQIAFCHLLFNIIGILIWFPVPLMRSVVIKAVCTLAFYASYWRLVPLIYILVMFVAVPSICVAAGVVIFLALGAVRGFVWWSVWVGLQGDQGGKPRGV